ncbi:MAG: shikimate kinase AroK [Gammaproteobacteria bacterium]|nr:shikimate kinase AroK [Chromatiales bacterium]MDX5333862.1 shikimate kinase AroK [Gammaproteobacteria bacterium]MDX5375377.1 shikimate kinase AroK [Gammaproteobacteria bacterium]
MTAKRNIILVGPMGAGKSTVGRRLANLLGREFVDSDKEIEQRTGVDIPTIFEFEQEAGFRDREAAVIEELTGREGIVLATGGGAVLRPENRRHMKARGFVIYLRTSVDEQLRRTAHDRNRPLLQTPDPRARLETLLRERDPLYTEIADLVVDTDRGQARSLAQRIVKRLRQALGEAL